MSPLDLIPVSWRLVAILVVAAALLGGCFAWGHRAGAAGVQQRWDGEARKAADAALQQSEANRETESLRRRAQQGVVDGVRSENAALARRAADLDGVAGRVRDYADTLAARCAAGDPAAAAGSAPAAGAGLVLAQLYRGADREAVELARAYDAARSAGVGCERSYDSLTR